MFIIPTIEEKALTPELGGEFGDLKLWVRPYLSDEQKKESRKYWVSEFDKKSHVKTPIYDGLKFIQALDEILLSLVVGWENCEQEFNEENKTLLLRLADDLTAQDIDEEIKDVEGNPTGNFKTRKARLGEFVMKFASNSENFKKKRANT